MRKRDAERQVGLQLQRDREADRRDNTVIHASAIGMCRRRIGYGVLGYQPLPEEAHRLVTLDLGNALHDLVQGVLVRMGWIKARPVLTEAGTIGWEQSDDPESGCELPATDELRRIAGRCDGVTVPLAKRDGIPGLAGYVPDPAGERYLIEIKSISDRPRFWILGVRDGGRGILCEEDVTSEFRTPDPEPNTTGDLQQRLGKFSHVREVVSSRFGSKSCPVYRMKIGGREEWVTVMNVGNSLGAFSSLREPKPEHVLQASLYAAHFDLQRILFLYVGKDADMRSGNKETDNLLDVPLKIYEHLVRSEDLEAARQRARDVYAHTDQGELPPRDYTLNGKNSPCRYCPFAWQCWPESVSVDISNEQLVALGLHPLVAGPLPRS